jgi:hypothetical protein
VIWIFDEQAWREPGLMGQRSVWPISPMSRPPIGLC